MPMLLSDFALFFRGHVDRWTCTRDCEFARLVGRNSSRVVRSRTEHRTPPTVYVAPGRGFDFDADRVSPPVRRVSPR